jgi:hypothetical protein
MFKKMKLAILVILFAQIFTLGTKSSNDLSEINKKSVKSSSNSEGKDWILYDPVWYSYSPVYYTYTPVYYYYWDYWYYPSYWVVWRNDDNKKPTNEKKEKEIKPEDIDKELASLKKEIWGKENVDLKEFRENNKAYDPRWLMAQLKISRALMLDDIKNKENSNVEVKIKSEETILKSDVPKEVTKKEQKKSVVKKREDEEERTEAPKTEQEQKIDTEQGQKIQKENDQKTEKVHDQKKEKKSVVVGEIKKRVEDDGTFLEN